MRFAYADPPYLGQGRKHYGHQHADAADWDTIEEHEALIARLVYGQGETRGFDAWALSCSTPTLYTMLRIVHECASDPSIIRIGSWVKPFASYKPGVNPAYCWEPVIFWGRRSAVERGGRNVATVRDYGETHEPGGCCSPAVRANITMQKGTAGAKPDAFCFWLFDFLGARGGDDFTDLFEGSGAVRRAWTTYAWNNPGGASPEGA